MSNILLLKPSSTNGVLPSLTQKLYDELSQLTSCEMFDEEITPLSKSEFFNYVSRLNPKAIFSFNAAGAELDIQLPRQGKKNLFSLFPAVHIGWMVDHPVYHIPRLLQENQKRVVLFPSKDSIEFANDFKLNGIFSSLPFAGNAGRSMGKGHQDRQFDVVIVASWMGQAENLEDKYDVSISQALSDSVSMIQEKPFLDPYYVLLAALSAHQLASVDGNLVAQLTKELYSYQRKYNRITIISALVHSGLRIALVGSGWQSFFGVQDNVTYFDNIPHGDILSLYQDAKVVLNINPTHGASERLFDAIDAGAMVYSEFSMMLYEMFGSGNGVLFHNVNTQESSVELLKDIIQNNETESWASSAKQMVLSAHTWKHRAEYLKQLVDAYSGVK